MPYVSVAMISVLFVSCSLLSGEYIHRSEDPVSICTVNAGNEHGGQCCYQHPRTLSDVLFPASSISTRYCMRGGVVSDVRKRSDLCCSR